MPESRNLPEKKHRLPDVMSASSTSLDSERSTAVSERSAIAAALASLAPLAIEVAYGLTRKVAFGSCQQECYQQYHRKGGNSETHCNDARGAINRVYWPPPALARRPNLTKYRIDTKEAT
jgi:hypothetical protein